MEERTAKASKSKPENGLFFDAFQASPIGIALEDLEGRPLFVNPALCSMLGFSEEEMLGKHCVQFSPAEDAEKDWSLFQQLRAGLIDHYSLEKRYWRRDGSLIWGRLSISLFDNNASSLVVAMVEDITEKRMAQEDLQRSEASLQGVAGQLQHRADQLRRLASDLTLAEQHAREQLAKALHDNLQQLLFSAGLQLDRLAKHVSGAASSEAELVARARGDIAEAIAAVRSLSLELFPAVLHQGGLPVALTWLAARMNSQHGLTIDLSVDAKADLDRKDMRTLVFECVRELLFNVVKHARVDRASLELALTPDDALRITVTDRGAGFDPAVSFDQASTHPVGLGLFSIRERLALLGGRLEVTSVPGRGARFVLVAPRRLAGTAHQRGADEPVARTSTKPAFIDTIDAETGTVQDRPLRVVIADDHAVVRRGIRELFAERPQFHVVGEAADGFEAIAQAHALRPDVIVMDVSMPQLDGVEATRRIHADLPEVQIFGLSMHESTGSPHAIEEAGAAGYFTKSGDLQRLIDRLLAVHAGAAGSTGQPAPTFH
jgi:PAS domain S-box-containing protein